MISCMDEPQVNLVQCVGYDSHTTCKLCCSDDLRVEVLVGVSFPSLQFSRAEGLISAHYAKIEVVMYLLQIPGNRWKVVIREHALDDQEMN